jgi:competence protein ComEA
LILVLHLLPVRPAGYQSEVRPLRENVLVRVSGDVSRPGVYTCSGTPDARRLIRRAGGPAETASGETGPVHSGSSIAVVLTVSGPMLVPSEMSAYDKVTLGIPVALNRETAKGLTAIPGIGAKTADAIVAKRASAGEFERWDQLRSVKGIGPARLKKIKPYLTLAPKGR